MTDARLRRGLRFLGEDLFPDSVGIVLGWCRIGD
jgi:hypothetical protein